MKPGFIAAQTLALAVLVSAPVSMAHTQTDPLAVTEAYMAAVSAKDADTAMTFIDDAVVVTYDPPPPGLPPVLKGRQEFRTKGLAVLGDLIKLERVAPPEVDGNTVRLLDRLYLRSLQAAGITYIDEVDEFTVENGKIVALSVTLTPESRAKVQPILPATGSGGSPLLAVLALALIALGIVVRLPDRSQQYKRP